MSADVGLLIVLLILSNAAWVSMLWNLDGLWAARYNRLIEDSGYEWVDYECRDGHWTVTPHVARRRLGWALMGWVGKLPGPLGRRVYLLGERLYAQAPQATSVGDAP